MPPKLRITNEDRQYMDGGKTNKEKEHDKKIKDNIRKAEIRERQQKERDAMKPEMMIYD